jgi:hypothetical protein
MRISKSKFVVGVQSLKRLQLVPSIPILLLPSCVIRVGVHNWTDLSREKPHAVGMNHVRTQEIATEMCGLLNEQNQTAERPDQDH